MRKLAVICGFGGINAAGRSSGWHAFNRVVFDSLSTDEQQQTVRALAQLAQPQTDLRQTTWSTDEQQTRLNGSLIRQWDNQRWDANAVPIHEPFTDEHGQSCWRLRHQRLAVQSAGQAPTGFMPEQHYPQPNQARHHPRGLQMALYAASDALGQLGYDWEQLRQHLRPDQIAVYAGSAMGQLDDQSHGGMLQAALQGKRTSAKQCALGLAEMTADFVNAYVLGNVGATGTMMGACASFLYNLKIGLDDIQSGRRRLVLVGNSESPLTPEIVQGYHAMTALASEAKLRELDQLNGNELPNWRRASRPFGQNCGFTLGESAQFFILCDDELAIQLGLTIYAAVGDVFIHADGFKSSIASPGIGNYLTLGKAMGEARRWLGDDILRSGSFVQAHGSSTPQNRTTESEILSRLATTFGIRQWPITAIKAHIGHSISAASADQLFMTLGSWQQGWLPGITTTEALADDVHQQGLHFALQHQPLDSNKTPLAFINAKGFGGNNASGFVISPQQTALWLQRKYGRQGWSEYQRKQSLTLAQSQAYDEATLAGQTQLRYQFAHNELQPDDLTLSDHSIAIRGWQQRVLL